MGQIDLNSFTYNEFITKDDIFKYVTQEEIYSYYIEENINKLGVYNSPLRVDKIPSFALYFHKSNTKTLMFFDFATKDSGDCIILVCKLFGLNYKNALQRIAYDLGLADFDIETTKKIISSTKLIQKEPIKLGVKIRNWIIADKQFWNQFNISKTTLQKFNVYPISHIFYNNNAVPAANLAYVYIEEKDNKLSYKIYQPLEIKQKKWINNANYSIHQGYTQLPEKGRLLIITKSLKDVMSLHDCIGIPAIGLQSESVMMKESVMDEYKKRFKKVICLFDNDEAGIKLTTSFILKYNIPFIYMPQYNGVKDFSDLVKKLGINEANKILKNLIKDI